MFLGFFVDCGRDWIGERISVWRCDSQPQCELSATAFLDFAALTRACVLPIRFLWNRSLKLNGCFYTGETASIRISIVIYWVRHS